MSRARRAADSLYRDLTGFGPHDGAHKVAGRMALSLGAPLLILWAIGRVDLSIYATFGAFASLYGRQDLYRARVAMQAQAGVWQLAMLPGTWLAMVQAPAPFVVGIVAASAVLAVLLSAVLQWHPPGGIFAVFAVGATATIPTADGALWRVLVVGGGTVAWALLVTTLVALGARGVAEGVPSRPLPISRTTLIQACIVGIAAVLAGGLALVLIGPHWYWAMVAAVAAMSRPRARDQVTRGVQRLIGTFGGILVAAALLALHLPTLAVILVSIALQAAAELFVARNYAFALLFITPLALLMVHLASPTSAATLLRDRTLDTALGVAAATAVAIVATVWRRRLARRGAAA